MSVREVAVLMGRFDNAGDESPSACAPVGKEIMRTNAIGQLEEKLFTTKAKMVLTVLLREQSSDSYASLGTPITLVVILHAPGGVAKGPGRTLMDSSGVPCGETFKSAGAYTDVKLAVEGAMARSAPSGIAPSIVHDTMRINSIPSLLPAPHRARRARLATYATDFFTCNRRNFWRHEVTSAGFFLRATQIRWSGRHWES